MIRGHERVLEQYKAPPVFPLLFLGPESVGKWTTAEELRRTWEVADSDILRVRRLSVAAAREIVQFSSLAPMASAHRMVIVRLSQSTLESQHILLKSVEETPATTKFIFIATDEPLPTIMSRCITVPFRLLSIEDLTTILEDRGFKPTQAKVWAERGQGQVKRALAYREVSDAKPLVSMVVKAFREKDPALLDKAADGWTDAHTDLLAMWCTEAISGYWRVFTEEDADDSGRVVPLRILVVIRTDVRPKLVVKSVLADLLRRLS